jgi:hypothetical protein
MAMVRHCLTTLYWINGKVTVLRKFVLVRVMSLASLIVIVLQDTLDPLFGTMLQIRGQVLVML